MQASGVVVSVLSGNHWDLGSIPRSPKPLFIFFSTCSHAGLPRAFYHAPHASSCQVAGKADLKAKDERLWCYLVNARAANSGKSNRLDSLLGLRIACKPPFWAHRPPWFNYL